jgi:hypothetical protein
MTPADHASRDDKETCYRNGSLERLSSLSESSSVYGMSTRDGFLDDIE